MWELNTLSIVAGQLTNVFNQFSGLTGGKYLGIDVGN